MENEFKKMIPSKGQITSSGFAGILFVMAQNSRPEDQMYYVAAITGLCILYRVTDIIVRIWGKNDA